MPEFIKSATWMQSLWTGCIVMGLVYLLGLWDGHGSPAFIVGQIMLGVIGVLREIYIARHYVPDASKVRFCTKK